MIKGGYIRKPNQDYLLTDKGINDLGGRYRTRIGSEYLITERPVGKNKTWVVWPDTLMLHGFSDYDEEIEDVCGIFGR